EIIIYQQAIYLVVNFNYYQTCYFMYVGRAGSNPLTRFTQSPIVVAFYYAKRTTTVALMLVILIQVLQ
ncbi:hypothetical protein ACFKJN_09680, partial [Streptococcus agalactiae]|uniref:hypothetical protein n=1 Tax=Streptococcus agalactiae TaxID=1311 RepID=UPI00362FBF88